MSSVNPIPQTATATLPSVEPRLLHDGNPHGVEIYIGILTAIGGTARYIYDIMRNGKPFSWIAMLAAAFVSYFIGTTIGHLAIGQGLDYHTVMGISGLCSWMGGKGFEPMAKRFLDYWFPPKK